MSDLVNFFFRSQNAGSSSDADKLDGYHLYATQNPDGTFNNDGIFKVKEEGGKKVLVGILDIDEYNLSSQSSSSNPPPNPSTLDIFGDGSCIALFEFEDNTLDTGGVYNAIEAPNITYCDGKIGRAVDYYNKDHSAYIKTPIIQRNGIKEITISAWIKVYGRTGQYVNIWHLTPNDQNYSNNSRQPALWLNPSDNTRFCLRNDGVYTLNLGIWMSQGSIQYGQWHHIVQVVTLRQMRFYIDGVLTDVYDSNEDFLFNDGYFYIGDPWHIKNHAIDHVRIFLRALTDSEIQTLYNEGSQP